MEKEKITKVEMARRMRTSRAALDRLLAPGMGLSHSNLDQSRSCFSSAAHHGPILSAISHRVSDQEAV